MRFFRWLGGGQASGAPDELRQVDLFLRKWDEFATGRPDPAYTLGDHEEEFEAALEQLFAKDPPRAISRLVFYLLVQVGAALPADSSLGRAFGAVSQGKCRVSSDDEGESYFAGTVCLWWLRHGAAFPRYPLLEDWLRRDFARKTMIPMYRSMAGEEE